MKNAKRYHSVMLVCIIISAIVALKFLSSCYKYFDNSSLKLQPIKSSSENENALKRTGHTESGDRASKKSRNCENLLINITEGKWVGTNESLAREINDVYKSYWSKRGIQNQWQRQDGKCGYNNLQDKVEGSTWPRVGSWCDPHGNKPCCSDVMNGKCSAPSEQSCSCPRCVDTRLYKIAEAARWKPRDENCKLDDLTGDAACRAIENSIFSDIKYVGDSFIRNMFVSFMMLLSNDIYKGAWSKYTTKEQKETCHGLESFFWDKCRSLVSDVSMLLTYKTLCAGKPPKFTTSFSQIINTDHASEFLALVKERLGKKGTLVVVGVGLHMDLNSTATIYGYLSPAVDAINDYYATTNKTRWPKLIFVTPMPANLLKPPANIQRQSNEKNAEFSKDLKVYCDKNNISVMDFRNLSTLTQSYDGTHYGISVNLLKNQILLNYIASL